MSSASKLSAGVVVVRQTADGYRFLLLRAYRNWDCPKGLVEPNESPLEAAIRETAEETGIDDLRFAWGTDYIETPPYARGKVARYHVAATEVTAPLLRPNPATGRPEHHEFRWVTLDEALELVVPRIAAVVTWAAAKIAGEYRIA
jgi:8-oxo-dGTP pyrophosphatase MutT (NUDIX family)